MAKQKIIVEGLEIRIKKSNKTDYISLTDIAKKSSKEPRFIIRNWLRNSNTVKYLYKWEEIHFPNSNRADIGTVLKLATDNSVSLTPIKWIDLIHAKGIISSSGRYGGTFAHSDIALNFCYWLSPEFQIYFLKEFQRLKGDEQLKLGDPLNIKRFLASGNYSLLVSAILSQTDERLLTHPQTYKKRLPFAKESDILNKIVFGNTAKEWRLHNANKPSNRNQRDYATILDLVILNNLEFLDSMLLQWECELDERKNILKEAYDFQYPILKRSKTIKKMQELSDRIKLK